MHKLLTLFLLFLLLVATGGIVGCGDDGDTATITLDTLKGTYKLTAFTVTFDDGTIITQDDYSSYSGTWVISSDGNLSQTLTFEDTTDRATGTIKHRFSQVVKSS